MQKPLLRAAQSSYRKSLFLGAIAVLAGSFGAAAQVSSRTQDFSNTTTPSTLGFTVSSISNSGSYGYYTPAFVAGTGTFGVTDPNNSTTPNTLVLDFDPQTFQVGSRNNRASFQLGSTGFDASNQVRVDIIINGVTSRVLTLTGIAAGGGPSFAVGAGSTATVNYPTPVNTTVGSSGTGNVVINLPDFNVRSVVALRISIDAAKKATDVVDNVNISSSAPLPVELTRFAATAKGAGVSLNWATASERNNDRFEVQRSATGAAFETIGSVKGNGNSSIAREYAFEDMRPLAGLAYYRLKQVDADGTIAYSPVAEAKGAASLEALAYPNPSTEQITLAAGLGPVAYRIYNNMGQTVLHGQVSGGERLNVATLPKGPFFLELTSATGRTTQRLVRE